MKTVIKTIIKTKTLILSAISTLFFFFASAHAVASTAYLAVVDAGSSGSRLFLYSFDPADFAGAGVTYPLLVDSMKVKGGLQTISPSAVPAYVQPLFDLVRKDVPAGTPVNLYFLSTAGMRLISPDAQAAIYQQIVTTAKTAGLAPVEVKTIPGKLEGAFDWIAINGLLKNLGQPVGATVGVLDMGGASTEVTFATNQSVSPVSSEDSFTFQIGGQNYVLYSHSYLGIGQDEAMVQYMNDPACFPVGYPLPDGDFGNGKTLSCEKDLEPLLQEVQHVSTIQRFITPDSAMSFYAISGYAYTQQDKIFNLNTQLTAGELENAAINACQKSWQALNQEDPADPYLYKDCFSAALNVKLLEAYGFAPTETLIANNTVSGESVDWALGAAIYYVNSLPTSRSSHIPA
jgi:hypothetical protein